MKNYLKGNSVENPCFFLHSVWDLLLLKQSAHGFKSMATCWILMLMESLQNFPVLLSV